LELKNNKSSNVGKLLSDLLVLDCLKFNVIYSLKTRYSMLNKRMKKLILAMF